MGYSSSRLHWVLLMSDRNGKWRRQFTCALLWSDESRVLLEHSDGRVSMKAWLHPALYQWFLVVCPLVAVDHCSNASAYSDCVIPSCQHGSKSQNFSCTLLNLCHNNLRHFLRQKKSAPWYQQGVANELAGVYVCMHT